jgi:iron complex outermembrane receptor protein
MQDRFRFARQLRATVAAIGLVGAAGAATSAYAQAAPPGAGEGANPVGEIIVTAQRREESAQKVPISIQALSETQLQQMGIANTNDLPLAVPGLQISSSAANQLYYLRGVGSQQVGTSSSPEVATFVDGVYMPFASGALAGFSNIASVEVDKGPQGTLFGRNATGGVIQITTKDPEYELGGDVSLGYGSYDHVVGSLYVTGGLSDRVAASIALLADDQMDGFGRSQATGKDAFKRSIYSVRTKWLFELSDTTRFRFGANFDHVKGDAGGAIRPAKGVKLWNLATNTQQEIPGFYDTNQNSNSFHTVKTFVVSGTLDSDLDWAQLRSITAYQGNRNATYVDFDGGPETLLPVHVLSKEYAFTQELQLSSPSDAALVWTVGAFFLRQRGNTTPFQFGSPFATVALPFGIPLGDTYELYAKTTTTSVSGYGQATATIFPETRLTLGLRYTHDRKTIDGYGQISGPLPPAPLVIPGTAGSQKKNFGKPTWRIALDHDFAPNVKVYASYNRGFQSGGFNSNNATGYTEAANPPLDPEIIDAYEVGLKSEIFGRKLRFNVAGFWYDYKNLQQQIYVNGQLRTLNAGAARIKGVDFELVYQPDSSLVIGLVGEVLDAKFTDYANAPGYTYPLGYGIGPLVPTPIANAKGNYLLFAPKYTGTLYANHTLETGVGKFTTSANVAYNDGYYADPGNLYRQPHFTVVNLSEEWAPDDQFSIQFWVKNLFDEKYDQSVAAVGTVGFVGNTVGAPREIGLTARVKF